MKEMSRKAWLMRVVVILFTYHLSLITAYSQETPNERQAKRIFKTAYNHFYGKEGVSFSYKIDLLHIYKEEGTATYKGSKSKSQHKNTVIWDNGEDKYILRQNKKIVEWCDAKTNKQDDKLQKFKFYPDDFNYSIADDPEGLLVTLTAKSGAKGSMKKIQALLSRGTYYPKRLRIKVTLFWATITFANFQAGGIDDNTFNFPKEKYAGYKVIDKR